MVAGVSLVVERTKTMVLPATADLFASQPIRNGCDVRNTVVSLLNFWTDLLVQATMAKKATQHSPVILSCVSSQYDVL